MRVGACTQSRGLLGRQQHLPWSKWQGGACLCSIGARDGWHWHAAAVRGRCAAGRWGRAGLRCPGPRGVVMAAVSQHWSRGHCNSEFSQDDGWRRQPVTIAQPACTAVHAGCRCSPLPGARGGEGRRQRRGWLAAGGTHPQEGVGKPNTPLCAQCWQQQQHACVHARPARALCRATWAGEQPTDVGQLPCTHSPQLKYRLPAAHTLSCTEKHAQRLISA